jgi:hypothetical protein
MFAISIPIPPIAIAWLGLSLLIGLLALAKQRSFVGWLLASLLFTPFAAVVLFYLPPAKASVPKKGKTKSRAAPPPMPTSPSLFRRIIGAARFRMKESRSAKAVVGVTGAAHRSLERDIAKSVKSRFGRDDH